MQSNFPVTLESIQSAQQRIKEKVYYTPLLKSDSINKLLDAEVYFKCENLQRIGAFKMRGATNAVLKLKDKSKGVATHSSGNHAQALALAAKLENIPAYIVMPENAPQVKINAVKDFGAQITFCEPTLAAREANLKSIVEKTGAIFIPPYDYWDVIEGQGTCALEIFEEVKPDLLFVPVGGGGLLAGSLIASKSISADVKVFGCEPEGANDAYLSFSSGIRVTEQKPDTIADGLLTTLGEKNFKVIKELCDGILTVNDKHIVRSIKYIFERLKIVVEPSAAVGLAAAFCNKELVKGRKIVIILSGGNVDPGRLSNLF
ncbi:MAG: pyridoxal-phosphate dependent enzyme [Flavobacteriales bacterium]